METIKNARWAASDSWIAAIASLLPLWLLSIAILVEGFPRPPISLELAVSAFALAIAVSIVLLWRKWLTPELILYSLFPVILLVIFDEIATNYKTPFILVCGLILTTGIIGAKRSNSATVRWLILLCIAAATGVLASHAVQNYWHMVDDLVFGECFPYTRDCPPLSGNETAWWVLFFRF